MIFESQRAASGPPAGHDQQKPIGTGQAIDPDNVRKLQKNDQHHRELHHFHGPAKRRAKNTSRNNIDIDDDHQREDDQCSTNIGRHGDPIKRLSRGAQHRRRASRLVGKLGGPVACRLLARLPSASRYRQGACQSRVRLMHPVLSPHSTAMFGMESAQAARSSAGSSTTVPPAAANFSTLSAARPMATSATWSR